MGGKKEKKKQEETGKVPQRRRCIATVEWEIKATRRRPGGVLIRGLTLSPARCTACGEWPVSHAKAFPFVLSLAALSALGASPANEKAVNNNRWKVARH